MSDKSISDVVLFNRNEPEFSEYQARVPYPYATLIGDDHLYLEWPA